MASTTFPSLDGTRSRYIRETCLGKVKTCARLEKKEWVFLGLSTLNILTVIGLTIYRLVNVIEKEPESSDFTFAILLLVNAVFCLFYTIYGVFFEKKFELYALMAAIVVVGMYCLLEYFVFNKRHQTLIKMLRLIVFLIMAPINITLAYFVAKEFRFLNFNTVGALEVNQPMEKHLAISVVVFYQLSGIVHFLKFDCSVVLLALKDGTDISLLEFSSLIICLVFSFIWAVFGWFMVKKKLKWGAFLFAFLGLVKPCYYLYKVIKDFMEVNDDTVPTNDNVVYSLIAAVIVGMIVWLLLMIDLTFIVRNLDVTSTQTVLDIDYHQDPVETSLCQSDEHSSLLSARASPYYGVRDIQ